MGSRKILALVAEHALLLAALLFLIPAVPSERGQVYTFWPGPFVAVALFMAASRYVAIRADSETSLGGVLKILIFIIFGFVIFFRVFHY